MPEICDFVNLTQDWPDVGDVTAAIQNQSVSTEFIVGQGVA